ncbi:SufE family protein [Pseudoalteromonas sp.]|uniref:SufE family protein n=1 Tax=Pseudoalteromonas sp. TaxID=53249 RepID=UPI001BCEC0F9|nr:SufE family protein [Pseudoalteromonas sp.]
MSLPTRDDIIDDMAFFDDWEQRYQYIIDLGKSISRIDENEKTDENVVKGCQSKVWLISNLDDGILYFKADSDAVIINGLLALVMVVFNNKTPKDILAVDIDEYFKQLDLERHITPSRGNGLKAIVAKIQAIANSYAN